MTEDKQNSYNALHYTSTQPQLQVGINNAPLRHYYHTGLEQAVLSLNLTRSISTTRYFESIDVKFTKEYDDEFSGEKLKNNVNFIINTVFKGDSGFGARDEGRVSISVTESKEGEERLLTVTYDLVPNSCPQNIKVTLDGKNYDFASEPVGHEALGAMATASEILSIAEAQIERDGLIRQIKVMENKAVRTMPGREKLLPATQLDNASQEQTFSGNVHLLGAQVG